jgi:hypothetical protein
VTVRGDENKVDEGVAEGEKAERGKGTASEYANLFRSRLIV